MKSLFSYFVADAIVAPHNITHHAVMKNRYNQLVSEK